MFDFQLVLMPPRTVSRDLKDRIPALHYEQGYSVAEVCHILGVKKTMVYKGLDYFQRYDVPYNPHTNPERCHRPRLLTSGDLAFLLSLLRWKGTLYLDELQQLLWEKRHVWVLIPTLSRSLHRMQFTKKRVSARAIERNAELRSAYMIKIGELVDDPNMLMFTDESAKDERTLARANGWSEAGMRCVSRKFFVRGRRFSILPVLSLNGIIAHDIIEGPVSSERFLQFLRECVVRRQVIHKFSY